MAKTKRAPKSKTTRAASTTKTKKKAPTQKGKAKAPNLLARLRTRWQGFRAAFPSWSGEIAAVLLIVFGLVSLLILLGLSSSDAWLATSWGDTLRQLFGPPGALMAAAGIVAVGLFVLLPRVGFSLHVSWHRVLSGELAFLACLALLHLLSSGPAGSRALADTGQGGGYIGWVLSQLVVEVFGVLVALIVWGVVFAFSLAGALGLRRAWVNDELARLNRRAGRVARDIDPTRALPASMPDTDASPAPSKTKPRKRKPSKPSKKRTPHVRPKLSAPGLPGERPSIVPRGKGSAPKRRRAAQQEGFKIHDHSDVRKLRKRGNRLPSLDLLVNHELGGPDHKEITGNVRIIEETLQDFDIDAQVVGVKVGPTVTQYAVQPFREVEDEEGNLQMQRVRVRKIASLSGDLSLALEATRLRVEAPVPGTNYVGIEVPNHAPSLVAMRPLLESERFYEVNRPLAVPLGRDVSGAPVVVDLARMPHLLIAGTTGSGKSVCITGMATALLMNNTPEDVQMVMLDPKMVELMRFNGVPHLIGAVETDVERAVGVLNWATREMDRRYEILEKATARNVEIYNQRHPDERLPYLAIFVDEIGDMMLTMPDETERALCRLAQMARAVGIHLVIATQRPSTDIITGLIKANFPARMSFAVASGIDSRVILDSVGAESLLGQGDMLFLAPDAAGPQRIQGVHLSDEEVERVVVYWEDQYQAAINTGQAEPPPAMAPWEQGLTRREVLAETDDLLEEAIALVVSQGRASTSLIQRRLSVGYPRAARIMGYLEELGIVGEAEGGGRRRRVLIKPGEDTFRQLIDERNRRR